MTVVVDASQLPADRRLAAVAEAIEFSAAPFQIVHACPEDEVSTRIEYFTLGENHVVKTESSPLRLTSTRDLIRDSDPDQLFVNLRLTGKATHTNAPGRLLRAGDLALTAMWHPWEYFNDSGGSAAFHVPLNGLGLARDYVERSYGLIHASPLSGQLSRHLQILLQDAAVVSQGPAASMVGRATTDLVRAVLVSAVDEEPSRHDSWEESLVTVVKSYIAQHLADPNLGADRIAQAAFISVRQLYKLWDTQSCSLGQWILERRLEAACDALTSHRGRNQTIAAIARRWGFADATHFSRRFRQAYGMSPREWRHTYRYAAAMSGSAGA